MCQQRDQHKMADQQSETRCQPPVFVSTTVARVTKAFPQPYSQNCCRQMSCKHRQIILNPKPKTQAITEQRVNKYRSTKQRILNPRDRHISKNRNWLKTSNGPTESEKAVFRLEGGEIFLYSFTVLYVF